MKNLILILFAILVSDLSAQMTNYGITLKRNFATQLNYNPSKPQDGTFQWDNLSTNALGIFVDYRLGKSKLNLSVGINYMSKGCSQKIQTQILFVPSSFKESKFSNTFNYLNLDLIINYTLFNSNKLTVYPYVGIRQSSLMSYKLESNIFPINLEYPIKYYSNFNEYSVGLILGTGVRISNLLALEAETNLDFNYLVKRDNLEVKNWIWSIGATLNVAELLPPRKRLTEVKKIKKKLR